MFHEVILAIHRSVFCLMFNYIFGGYAIDCIFLLGEFGILWFKIGLACANFASKTIGEWRYLAFEVTLDKMVFQVM